MRTDFPSRNVNVNVRYFSNFAAHVLSLSVYNQLEQAMREQRELWHLWYFHYTYIIRFLACVKNTA